MAFKGINFRMGHMKKWPFYIAGMPHIDSQIIYFLNFKDTRITIRIHWSLSKLWTLFKNRLFYLMATH